MCRWRWWCRCQCCWHRLCPADVQLTHTLTMECAGLPVRACAMVRAPWEQARRGRQEAAAAAGDVLGERGKGRLVGTARASESFSIQRLSSCLCQWLGGMLEQGERLQQGSSVALSLPSFLPPLIHYSQHHFRSLLCLLTGSHQLWRKSQCCFASVPCLPPLPLPPPLSLPPHAAVQLRSSSSAASFA